MGLPAQPHPDRPEPPRLTPPREKGRTERLLEVITLAIGPGVLTDWLLHTFGHGEISQLVAFTVAAVFAAALYTKKIDFAFFQTRKRVAIPWAIVLTLSLVLLLVVHRPLDRWVQWQRRVDSAVQKCKTDECVGAIVGDFAKSRPLSEGVSKNSQLLSELLTGQLLLQNKRIADTLDTKVSVNSRFLGSGFALPVGAVNFTTARMPEYFVRNLPSTAKQVWTWRLEAQNAMDLRLEDVLRSTQPVPNGQPTFALETLHAHLQPNDDTPLMVRFARLEPGQYHGCLGKPSATHVFMMDLGEALRANLTVYEATTYSGYAVSSDPSPGSELFIWVYQPLTKVEVIPATWGAVVSNLSAWTSQEGCRAM